MKAWPARITRVIKLNTQVPDLLSIRKVTGRAGLAGLAVAEGNTPGHAAVTQLGSLELCAEETPVVKNTAKQMHDH